MKTSPTIRNIFSLVKAGLAVTALAALPACASSSWTRQANSGLPIEAVHSPSGVIMSFQAHETSDRLYVAGRAKPHQLLQPMHVDIQLIGADGRLLAEKTDSLDGPRHPRTGSGRHGHRSYVASFPLSEARQAVKIRVVYHAGPHSKGNS